MKNNFCNMRFILSILSVGIICVASGCKQETKEESPFNDSVCDAVEKRATTGITDLAEGETCSVSLCEEKLLNDGVMIENAYGSYWKETGSPNVQQLSLNNFFTLSHQTVAGEPSSWQGFTISNVYYPDTNAGDEPADLLWSTQADGGLLNPYIPFPLEPNVKMAEGVTGVPFLIASWSRGKEVSLENINNKFSANDFSCWIKLGEKEDYLPRGFYLSLSSLPSSGISEGHLVVRGVDTQGKYSRATIKTPFVATVSGISSKDKWRWVDLSRLGKVQYLVFQVDEPNKEDANYYFCMDALSVEK